MSDMIDKKHAELLAIKTIESEQHHKNQHKALLGKLKKLLPHIINSDNKLDIASLQDTLNISHTTNNELGYELTFVGKKLARAAAHTPTKYELKAEKHHSKNFDNTHNVVIRGDNLEALKILYQNYYEKVKMIYIDPPYNTYKESFIYNDNFKLNDKQLKEKYKLDAQNLNTLNSVYSTRSHSGWLSFMYPRLKIARELLTKNGIIFISIDDHEQANLKILCDEIFGVENFIANFVWRSSGAGGLRGKFATTNHEYILAFAKEKNANHKEWFAPYSPEALSDFNYKDEKGQYKIQALYLTSLLASQNQLYPIQLPDGTYVIPPLQQGAWRFVQKTFLEEKNKGNILFRKTQHSPLSTKDGGRTSYNIYVKQYINNKGATAPTWLADSYVGQTRSSKSLLSKIFNQKNIFDYAKPISLIEFLASMSTEKNDLILDFFAGSGTTAHALMQLNAKDKNFRKFILVQWDEEIDSTKYPDAYNLCIKNNFPPTISSVTIERLNRAGEYIVANNNDYNDTSHTVDIGYKVYSLKEKPKIIKNIKNSQCIFTIDNKREKAIDTLTNMLAATGKTLDTPIETLVMDKCYCVENELYLLSSISYDIFNNYAHYKIYLDGWAQFNITDFLKLNIFQKSNITVVY